MFLWVGFTLFLLVLALCIDTVEVEDMYDPITRTYWPLSPLALDIPHRTCMECKRSYACFSDFDVAIRCCQVCQALLHPKDHWRVGSPDLWVVFLA